MNNVAINAEGNVSSFAGIPFELLELWVVLEEKPEGHPVGDMNVFANRHDNPCSHQILWQRAISWYDQHIINPNCTIVQFKFRHANRYCLPVLHQGPCATLNWAPPSQNPGATTLTYWRRWAHCPPSYASGASAYSSGGFWISLAPFVLNRGFKRRVSSPVQASGDVLRVPGLRPLRGGAVLRALRGSDGAHQAGQHPGIE